MILRLLDTLFWHLEKFRYLKRKFLKGKSLSSGDWVLVEETVYFQNQSKNQQLPSIVPLLLSLGLVLYQLC